MICALWWFSKPFPRTLEPISALSAFRFSLNAGFCLGVLVVFCLGRFWAIVSSCLALTFCFCTSCFAKSLPCLLILGVDCAVGIDFTGGGG